MQKVRVHRTAQNDRTEPKTQPHRILAPSPECGEGSQRTAQCRQGSEVFCRIICGGILYKSPVRWSPQRAKHKDHETTQISNSLKKDSEKAFLSVVLVVYESHNKSTKIMIMSTTSLPQNSLRSSSRQDITFLINQKYGNGFRSWLE